MLRKRLRREHNSSPIPYFKKQKVLDPGISEKINELALEVEMLKDHIKKIYEFLGIDVRASNFTSEYIS